MKAFTSKFTHLGHIATSRGEGGHHHFKQYLQSNRHDLLDLKDKWSVMLRVFQVNFSKDLALARDRIYHELSAKRWDYLDHDLNKQIVPAAMKLLVRQLLLANDEVTNNKPCSGGFETIHGIPCYHTLREIKRLKTKVTKAKFHKHWHFERPVSSVEDGEVIELPPSPPEPITASPHIFAPRKVVTRGRRRKDRTTRRDPSQFEITAGTTPPAPRAERPGLVGGETFIVRACEISISIRVYLDN